MAEGLPPLLRRRTGCREVQRLGQRVWVVDTIRELERGLHEGALLKPYIHGRTNRRSMCSVDETVCCAWCGLGYGERNRFDCWPGPTVKKSVESCFFSPFFQKCYCLLSNLQTTRRLLRLQVRWRTNYGFTRAVHEPLLAD